MKILAANGTYAIYGIASGDMDTKPKVEIERFLVVGWEWGDTKPASPVLMTPLLTARPKKNLFQFAEVLGYETGIHVFDADGRAASKVKLENEFRTCVEEEFRDWRKNHEQ